MFKKVKLDAIQKWCDDPLQLFATPSPGLEKRIKRFSTSLFSVLGAMLFFALSMHSQDAHALLPAANDMVPATVNAQGSFLGKSGALITIGLQLFFSGLGAFVLLAYGWALINTFGEARSKREWGHFAAVFVVGTLVLAAVETGCITGFTYSTNLASLVA